MKKNKKVIFLCKIFIFLFIVLIGLNAQSQDVNKKNIEPKPEKQTQGEDLQDEDLNLSVIMENMKPFNYDFSVNRDPFRKPLSISEISNFYGPFLKTQIYNLKDYKLKGLIWKTRDPKAIFESPSKEEYRLSVKDYIGENFGFIAVIREKEVVVIQTKEIDKKKYSTTKVIFLK